MLGLVTERSFLHYAARFEPAEQASLPELDVATCDAKPRAESPASRLRAPDVRQLGGITTIMTPLKDILHVSLNDEATKCVDILFSKNATHLPVIDGGHLSGIISLTDLIRPLLPPGEEAHKKREPSYTPPSMARQGMGAGGTDPGALLP